MTNVITFEEELEKIRKIKQEKEHASKYFKDMLTKTDLVIMKIKEYLTNGEKDQTQ